MRKNNPTLTTATVDKHQYLIIQFYAKYSAFVPVNSQDLKDRG